jgi:hypothetical protein
MSGEHLGERALPGTVRPHDRMDLPGIDGEVDAAEDLLVAYRGPEALDL